MINIDYSRDELITEFALRTLKERYMLSSETSPQEAFARASEAFADNSEHAQRLYDYVSKQWFMFATPVLSNGGTNRGYPISCFLNYVPDSRKGLMEHYAENAYLSSGGGGIGGYWGSVRSDGVGTSSGSRSNGSIPFMKIVDSQMMAFSQGATRRGSYAAYQDISHPEIEEFIVFRKPSGGDPNRRCLNLHHGVNIPDKFMDCVDKDLDWDLIDPHTGNVTKTVKARALWEALMESRIATGEPYLHFIDTTNRLAPESYKALGLTVNHSNLCSEITLHTSEERTAVCCLSSVNLEKYDEWKHHPTFIADLIRMLDNVLEAFIDKAPEELSKAKYSAYRERSLGLGAMGFHAYLQSKMVPFESPMAMSYNLQMFKHISEQARQASMQLTEERGPCPDAEEAGLYFRNSHLLAVAPNASSSILCSNTSPSIEPYSANAYTQKTLSGSSLVKNKYLQEVLKKYGADDKETWKSITTNNGSVQHLDFLEDWEKYVFKTAFEINQHALIELAAARQPYICQAQSLNLFFPAGCDVSYFHKVHLAAFKKGLKTLYYTRSTPVSEAFKVGDELQRAEVVTDSDCVYCEG